MNLDSYEKLLAMYLLQKQNLPTYKMQVGATDDDLDAVTFGADNLQYLKNYSEIVEADKMTVNRIKRSTYDGDPNAPVTTFGGFPAFAPPHPLVAGLKESAQKRNRRFKAADAYTKEIGIALGIEDGAAARAPEEIKATFEAFPSQMGYEAALVVSNRGKSNMWKALGQKANSPKWSELASNTGKSGNVKIEPATPGQPERILVMIQLYKNNEPYGQPSDPQYVTFNP